MRAELEANRLADLRLEKQRLLESKLMSKMEKQNEENYWLEYFGVLEKERKTRSDPVNSFSSVELSKRHK